MRGLTSKKGPLPLNCSRSLTECGRLPDSHREKEKEWRRENENENEREKEMGTALRDSVQTASRRVRGKQGNREAQGRVRICIREIGALHMRGMFTISA